MPQSILIWLLSVNLKIMEEMLYVWIENHEETIGIALYLDDLLMDSLHKTQETHQS